MTENNRRHLTNARQGPLFTVPSPLLPLSKEGSYSQSLPLHPRLPGASQEAKARAEQYEKSSRGNSLSLREAQQQLARHTSTASVRTLECPRSGSAPWNQAQYPGIRLSTFDFRRETR